MMAMSRAVYRPGEMNKTEAAYADLLDKEKAAGKIIGWKFEEVRLVLAKRTTYTPDFMVTMANSEIKFVEVKGFWRDDARVKIKVAADKFREFLFIAVKRVKGRWSEEEILPR